MLNEVLFTNQYEAAERFAPVFEAMGWNASQTDIEEVYDDMWERMKKGGRDNAECGRLKIVRLTNGKPLFGLMITDTTWPPLE